MSSAGSLKLSTDPTAVTPTASAALLASNAPLAPSLPAAIEKAVPAATIREATISDGSKYVFKSQPSASGANALILVKLGGVYGNKKCSPSTQPRFPPIEAVIKSAPASKAMLNAAIKTSSPTLPLQPKTLYIPKVAFGTIPVKEYGLLASAPTIPDIKIGQHLISKLDLL